ncbi:hypothetical protein M9H77_21369 [Catharanthus roseus]|uniref:Uncharacterized protein n=1 Tax=Catharanthus roseus TaxID=4058 RepID=A0ACC0AN66_CATRO|nr:hypothetical protein M9H77_21369 [Catharanthus roseus]
MAADAASATSMVTSNAAAAVKALLKWKDAQSATQKPQLLPQDDFIYLNLTLKKIPQKPRTNPYKICIPHPLFDASSEFCLIIDDRPTSNLTKETAQKIIKSQNIAVSKVLKLSKLKTNYKPFEAKRKLCDSYDLFLVDRRIVHFLPKLLGKSFFKKKKLPIPLDLTHKNWREQIERAAGCSLLYMRTGTCCVMKAAKVSMESEEIVENVVEAIKGAVQLVPKKWGGLRSLHLKFSDSLALPVYQALPDVKFRIAAAKESDKASNVEAEVKEESRGEEKKGKKKKKGRIHEVRYMDVGAGEAELVSEDDEDKEEKKSEDEHLGGTNDESHGKMEVNKSEEDDDDFDSPESEGDKSKKGKLKGAVLSLLGDGKRGKKVVKHREIAGKKKRSSSEGAEASLGKKTTKRIKTGKVLKEGSPAKKAKRGKSRMSV